MRTTVFFFSENGPYTNNVTQSYCYGYFVDYITSKAGQSNLTLNGWSVVPPSLSYHFHITTM